MRVPALALVASAVIVVTAPPAAATDEPAYFWRWSDGSRAAARTLSESRLDARMPDLVVDTHPATANRRITLQFRDHGRWRTEDSDITDASGSARLELNPYCADGAWCSRAFDYRLRAGGRTARLTVAFAR
jgi:hypothetical protein